jgi:hypothetical protein
MTDNYGPEIASQLDSARKALQIARQSAAIKTVVVKSHDDAGIFQPGKFILEYKKFRSSGDKIKHFSEDELSNLDEVAGMMKIINNELGQKVSDKGPLSLLATTGGLGTIGGAIQFASGIPAAIPAMSLPVINAGLSHRAGQMFKPGSTLYKNMLGDPNLMSEVLPGVVNVGGKLILLKGGQAAEEAFK